MKNVAALSEDFLLELYDQPAFLPPLWRVIFQEAMRGHHILFSKTVVQAIDGEEKMATPSESMEEFCVHLFAAPDLKTIKSMISFLPTQEQKQLFGIYLNLMQSFREDNKRYQH